MNSKSTLWALVILAALGAYVYFFERGKASEPGGVRPLSQVLGFSAQNVSRIQLDRQGDPLWLARDNGDEWRVTKPANALADAEEVKRILEEVGDTMVDRVLTEKVEDLKPFGLAEPRWELTIATRDGKTRTLQVGGNDPTNSALYLKYKDRDQILIVPANTLAGLETKRAEELRDKTIMSFKKDAVQRIELASDGQKVQLERAGDQWRITAPIKAKAQKERVDGILLSFEKLKGTRIIADEAKDLKQYGLDKPVAQVSVWVRGEREPHVALFGSTEPESGELFAKAGKNPAILAIYPYVLNDARLKAEDLKEPEPVKEEKKKADDVLKDVPPPPVSKPSTEKPAAPPVEVPAVKPPSAETTGKPAPAKKP